MNRIYLDANGFCPPIESAYQKLVSMLLLYGNPSSFHSHGRQMRAYLDEARSHVAQALCTVPKSVIFSSGASEANRLFVDSLLSHAQQTQRQQNILVSPFEHPSLLKPILALKEHALFNIEILEINSEGEFMDLKKLCSADVVICTTAHSETGILPDLSLLQKHLRKECILMSDITQSFSRLKAPPERIDVMSCSAQKMGAFSGIGALVLRNNAQDLPSPWQGGGQERGFRPGTESVPLIAAFGEAAALINESRAQNEQLTKLRDHLETEILSRGFFKVKIIGRSQPRLGNTSAICFLNQDPDALRIACDLAGLSVGFGTACSGLAPEGSFALKKLGLSLAQEKCTLRFSLNQLNTKEEIDETIHRLCGIIK